MRHLAASLVAVALFGLCCGAEAQPAAQVHACTARGRITDEDGGVIAKVYALIHSEARGSNQQVVLNEGGRFKVTLRAGVYDLFVSSPGLVPQAQVIDLRSCKPVDLNMMMPLDGEPAAPGGGPSTSSQPR